MTVILDELKIELTNRCLLNCVHCSTSALPDRKTFLPNSLVETLIDQAVKFGCPKICFSGGEPLLHSRLDSFLKKLDLNGIQGKVYSTGITQLNPPTPISFKKLKALKFCGLSNLVFSLYSSESRIHDSITQISGSFKATIAAIKNSLQAGIKTEIHFVALKELIDELHPLSEFVRSLGIEKISILRFVPHGRGKLKAQELMPVPLDFIKLRRSIITLRKEIPSITLRLGSPFNFLLIDPPKPCTAGVDRMIIDPNGFAYPCDALKQVKLAEQYHNALMMPLLDIFKFDPLFQIARQKDMPVSCDSCSDVLRCLGGCLAQRLFAANSSSGPDPACLRKFNKQSPGFSVDIISSLNAVRL